LVSFPNSSELPNDAGWNVGYIGGGVLFVSVSDVPEVRNSGGWNFVTRYRYWELFDDVP
jgi:hypothetical protein